MKKLEKKFISEWLKALRSGKYKQTRETLCRLNKDGEPRGYCCLGVAAHVMGVESDNMSHYGTLTALSAAGTDLPQHKLAAVLSIGQEKLVAMNDTWRWDFKRIADWIEKNLLKKNL